MPSTYQAPVKNEWGRFMLTHSNIFHRPIIKNPNSSAIIDPNKLTIRGANLLIFVIVMGNLSSKIKILV